LQGPKDRADQQLALSLVRQHVLQQKRGGIIVADTGAGKTLMTSYIITEMLGVKSAVVVNSKKLRRQFIDDLKRFVPGIRIGIVQGTVFETRPT